VWLLDVIELVVDRADCRYDECRVTEHDAGAHVDTDIDRAEHERVANDGGEDGAHGGDRDRL
jgi:hypothetical protein